MTVKIPVKEFTLRISISDQEKWEPIFKELMLKPRIAEEKYGFSVNASAHGDLFAERDIYERALEKVEQNDLCKEDLFTNKEIKSEDEDFDPYFADTSELSTDAFEQAKHHRDKRNLEYGTQRPLPLSFQKGNTNEQQNLST